MALERYRQKRDFGITPEPQGRRPARAEGRPLSFVIQKHAASHLHYDFRLELDGVLLSWAVPKGPSLNPADKRLAVQVEDHPLEYGRFEGLIPENQYGGGTVMLWDRGTWIPRDDAKAGLAKGNLKFELDGEKLKGGFALIRTHGGKYGRDDQKTWLLIKEKDAYAQTAGRKPIVEKSPASVASGRSLDAIAKARQPLWQSNRSVKAKVKAGAAAATEPAAAGKDAVPSRDLPGVAKRARLPALLSPMLTTLVDQPPAGEGWLHEIKYDGYRLLARIERGKARLYSRSGKEWTSILRPIADALGGLNLRSGWIDGEVCAQDKSGRTSFQALQNALAQPDSALTYVVFDLMYRDGYDLRALPLTERKRRLRELIGNGSAEVKIGPEVAAAGAEFFRQACALGLEGAVCKRADSRYLDGARSRDWVKVKCLRRQEMVIGGYTDPQGSREGFGALLLGVYQGGDLHYAGKVGTGFDARTLASMYPRLKQRERRAAPFVDPPRGFEAKGAHWIAPDLVAEVAFTEWSGDGLLRHPAFKGLRADKKASDVIREGPVPMRNPDSKSAPVQKLADAPKRRPAAAPKASANLGRRSAAPPGQHDDRIAGIALSHPDKLYFPEAGLTKRDLAAYYEFAAPWLLPHLARRPLSLVRCPDGWQGQCFYQKHADPGVNAAVARIEVPESGASATYMGAASAQALVALVQWGVIEFHPWGSRAPRLDRPDRLVFDFDPDEGREWAELRAAIGMLRQALDDLGLTGFLKTTGGKGLHVVVPIRPTLSWDDAKGFSRAVADMMVTTMPERFTTHAAKAGRRDRIFIDYLRNAVGATAVAPYSVRARKNAPVATPIEWNELAQDVRFDHFNVRNLRRRLDRGQDPWVDFGATKQTITRTVARRVGYALGG